MQTARPPEDRGWLKGGGLRVRHASFVLRWRALRGVRAIPFPVGRAAMDGYTGCRFEPCPSAFGGPYPAGQDSRDCHTNNPRGQRAEASAGIGAFLLGVN